MPTLAKSAACCLALMLLAACTTEPAVRGPAGPDMAATGGGQEGRSCFWSNQVSGFSDATEHRILVHTGPNEVYLFQTLGTCPNMDFAQAIGFDVSPPGMICSGIDVTLIVPSSIGRQRCPVRMIRKMTEAEANGLAR